MKKTLLIVLVVFLLLISIPYFLGYRLGSGLKIQRVGTLALSGLPQNASVILDQSLEGKTPRNGILKAELMTGSHSVIVAVPGDYPWNNLVPIASGKTTTISPILIPLHPDITLLSGTAATQAAQIVASTTLPTISNPLRLANGCAAVYVTNNQIIEEATSSPGCTPPAYLCDTATSCSPTIIFSPIAPLNVVAKFPNRQDALVIEFNKTIYAIAADPRTPQFFAPILTGTDPGMGVLPNGTIVVVNASQAFTLNL